MRAPSKATDHMAGIGLDGLEGRVNGCSAHSVVNDIEALTVRVERDVLRRRKRAIINADRAEPLNDVRLFGRHSSEDFGAQALRELNGDMSHAPGTRMDKYLLPLAHMGLINQSLPGSNRDKGKGCGLSHSQRCGLQGKEVRIDDDVLRQSALKP